MTRILLAVDGSVFDEESTAWLGKIFGEEGRHDGDHRLDGCSPPDAGAAVFQAWIRAAPAVT